MENPFPVISDSYCAPHTINLRINTKKGITYDANNACRFYIKDKLFTLHKRRVLCDNQGSPIVTLYKKKMTLHGRCQAFRGEKGKDSSQLLFSVKRSSMIKSGMINLEVFLANNQRESACDFRVNACRDKSSCTVYAGESPTIVATMENNGGFNVLVYPHVDYAFIVALLMIVNEITHYFDEMVTLAAGIAKISFASLVVIDERTQRIARELEKLKAQETRERKEMRNRKVAWQKAVSVILWREATKAVIDKSGGGRKKKGPITICVKLSWR